MKVNWYDVFGSEMTASAIVEAAANDGVSVTEWLRQEYYDLGVENPDGGWNDIDDQPFTLWALHIEAKAERELQREAERCAPIHTIIKFRCDKGAK